MKKIVIEDNPFSVGPICACIGYFDGLHRGHRRLIAETKRQAEKAGCACAAICFEPDPLSVITGKSVEHIFPSGEREKLFEEAGMDYLFVIRFDTEMMHMSPQDFIYRYLDRMDIVHLICGYDFRFGYKGEGDAGLLSQKGGFALTVIEPCLLYGQKISSSRIRQAIKEGRFKLVKRLLSYDYYLLLKVDKCVENGSKWLIYGSMLDEDAVRPKDGDYEGFTMREGRCIFTNETKLQEGQIFRLKA